MTARVLHGMKPELVQFEGDSFADLLIEAGIYLKGVTPNDSGNVLYDEPLIAGIDFDVQSDGDDFSGKSIVLVIADRY